MRTAKRVNGTGLLLLVYTTLKTNSLHILLIEDDALDIKNMHRAFKENDLPHILHVAGNGRDALAMLRRQGDAALTPAPNMIILDIRMPHMDGIEFLRELRLDPVLKAIGVYVITNSDEEQHKLEAYNLNVAGYIVKPINYRQFVAAIKALKDYWQLIELPDRLSPALNH